MDAVPRESFEASFLQELPSLRDLEIVFGHELSDSGISKICNIAEIHRLKLVNFIRLHDCNIKLLSCLHHMEELVIQVLNLQSLLSHFLFVF